MNVLYIVKKDGETVLEPEGFFAHPVNRYRDISVDDPEHVYGPPIYEGPAYLAPRVLEPGAYWWEYTERDDEAYSD